MTQESAQAIINRAMSDPEVYRKMSEEEDRLWSDALTDSKRQGILHRHRTAGARLGLGKGAQSLAQVAKARGLSFEYGLSVGCGAGRAERRMLKEGVCRRFHGVDIAKKAVEEAEATARTHRLPITYEVVDLNTTSLGEAKYDLVVAQTSLHHVLFLEKVIDAIFQAVKPGGHVWVQDFIGESQFQFSEKRRHICNKLIACIPERYRINELTGALYAGVPQRKPGKLGSPFESIRSGEIEAMLKARFDLVHEEKRNAIASLVFPLPTRANYEATEEGRAIFAMVLAMDDELVANGVLEGTDGRFLLRRPLEPPGHG